MLALGAFPLVGLHYHKSCGGTTTSRSVREGGPGTRPTRPRPRAASETVPRHRHAASPPLLNHGLHAM